MQWFLEELRRGVVQMTWMEVVGVIFGLLSVFYSKNRNILVFPTGIVSTIIYIYLCFGARLYADMSINVYYTVASIYGWVVWTGKGRGNAYLPVSYNSRRENLLSVVFFALAFPFFCYILTVYTDSDVPIWDSLTTAIFVVGMWLMAKKKVENWIAWIIGDLISAPLYFYKGLVLTGAQLLVFTVLATMGLIAWINDVKRQQQATA